jgi:starch phosphorylase
MFVACELFSRAVTLPDKFYISSSAGGKLTDADDIANVEKCLRTCVKPYCSAHLPASHTLLNACSMIDAHYAMKAASTDVIGRRPTAANTNVAQPGLIYSLMDSYIKNDVLSVQESIVQHVEYSIGRTRYRFDDFEAYQAASLSVRDRLIESWNDTNQHYREVDPKRVYYLSMGASRSAKPARPDGLTLKRRVPHGALAAQQLV